MGNSWKRYESCLDLKKPFTQKGMVAVYELRLDAQNLESKKVDVDKVKAENNIQEKVADAFFFICKKSDAEKEKLIIVET